MSNPDYAAKTNQASPSAAADARTATSVQTAERLIRVLAFTLILSSMSATMFNIVLPGIAADFGLSFSQVSWVSSAYTLIYAIGSVIYGKLADTYKLKHLLTFGLSLFAVGSVMGLAAQSYAVLLIGRIVQAAGASVIPATAMIIPVRYFPAETRGRALGISATGLAVGGALGPVIAAFVTSAFNWRFLFGVPLLVLFTLPLYRKYITDGRGEGKRIDWLGGGLLAGSVAALLLAVTQEQWPYGAGGVLLLAAFVWRIRRAAEPFVQPRLFANRKYTAGLVLAMLVMSIGFSLPFLTPQLLSAVNGLSTGWIGFAMVPGAAVSALLGRSAGKLADRKGNIVLFYIASTMMFACFALLSVFVGVPPIAIALLLVLGNVGQMFLQIALSSTISRTLPKEQTGVGMGLLSMLNFLVGAVSTGIYGKVADLGAATAWNPLNVYPHAALYSNLYLVLALLYIVIVAAGRRMFR